MPEETPGTPVLSIAAGGGEVNANPTNEAPAQEGASPEVPSAPSTLKIGDREMSMAEVEAHVKELEMYRDYGRAVVNGSEDPVKNEQATRFLLADAGYTPAQIETYLQAARADLQAGDDEVPTEDQKVGETEEVDPRDAQIQELRAELAAMRESQSSQRTDMLRRSMEQTLDSTIKNHPGVKKLLETARTLNGEEGMSGRVDRLKGTIERQLLDNLKRRVNRGEQFSVSWLDEEASKAAESVLDTYRSVIGDPDKLQRAPETAAEEEGFVKREPVKPIVADPNEPIADASARAEKFTLDTLLEVEQAVRTSGESKA